MGNKLLTSFAKQVGATSMDATSSNTMGTASKFGNFGSYGALFGKGMGGKKLGELGAPTKAEAWNDAAGQTMDMALGATTKFMGIANSGMNQQQKNMATVDAGVDTAADVAGMFGPVGSAIGAGMKIVNAVGGALMGTPKSIKDFGLNDTVGASSSFGGVTSDAQETDATADSYSQAGLAGKLFGKKKLLNSVKKSNMQQGLASGVLDASKLAKDSAASSTNMFSTRNQNKLQNTGMFSNGSVQMGQEGGVLDRYIKLSQTAKTLNVKLIAKKAIAKHQLGGNVIAMNRTEEPKLASPVIPVAPAVKAPFGAEQRELWNRFTDFVKDKGYKGNPELDNRDKTLSRDLWDQYATSSNIDVPYDEFIPRVQEQITGYRNKAIDLLKSGKSQIEGYDGDINKFDFDNGFMKGLSQIDGWAGSKTTSWRFPNEKVINPITKQPTKENNIIYSRKDGGVMNVIVDGALHARKHDLKDHENFLDANITLKGIPVVTKSEGGEIKQHAEVEVNELILHLELTKKLEALLEEDTDESAIEAGKLLAKEIVKNTKDSKSKILKSVE